MIVVDMKKFWAGVASSYKCIMAIVNGVSARFPYANGGRDGYSSL